MNTQSSNFGISYGIDGEIIQLTKYKKNWNEIFEFHDLDIKYKTLENFETYCWLTYANIDADSVFVEKIRILMLKNLIIIKF